jgi:hypothetical protein
MLLSSLVFRENGNKFNDEPEGCSCGSEIPPYRVLSLMIGWRCWRCRFRPLEDAAVKASVEKRPKGEADILPWSIEFRMVYTEYDNAQTL